MSKQARNYTSDILDELMSEITPEEQLKTDKRMLLALKIEKAMKAKGWRKGDLAFEMKKYPSVITRWLSGTHNFESDTFFELEEKLGICLISVEKNKPMSSVPYQVTIQSTVETHKTDEVNYIIPSKCFFFTKIKNPKTKLSV